MKNLLKGKENSQKHLSGFTIIELMVTVTIVVLVTGIVMVQYSSFNSSILLTSQAYLTAFDLREAQTLAVGVRGQGGSFYEEYGLYFDIASAQPNLYVLFQDDDSNGKTSPARYNTGEEIGLPYKFGARYVFENLCVTYDSGTRACHKDDPKTSIDEADASLTDIAISFRRPDFDAGFYSYGKSGIVSAELIIGIAGTDRTKKVLIGSTGQISVQ